jgi:Sec-independent protein translocase protein TatA
MGLLLIIILFIFIFWFFTKDLGRDLRLFAGWLNSLPAKMDQSIEKQKTHNTKMEALTAKLQAKLDLKNAQKLAEKAAKKP